MLPIILFIFLGLVVVNFIFLVVTFDSLKSESVSTMFKVRRIVEIGLLIELNVLNFSLIFIPQRYLGELILVVLFNLVSLLFFFWDLIYLSQRKREYILWLQSKVFSMCSLKDIFTLKENDGGDYKEIKAYHQQRCSIVKKANESSECIKIGPKDNPCYLIPKKELSRDTLIFCCLKIELDWDNNNKPTMFFENIDPVVIKEYDNEKLPKIYQIIKCKFLRKKTFRILETVGIFILIILVAVVGICEINGIDSLSWLAIVI